jgi:FKBP-type peptidyl-prolyl cis-trans isomerase FkpA
MNMLQVSAVVAAAAIVLSGCTTKQTEATSESAKLVTTADTVSYLIGCDIARSLKSVKDDIVLDIVCSGMKDGLEGKQERFTPDQERVIMEAFSRTIQQKQMAKTEAEANANLAEAKKFLDENGKKKGVVTTPSGLQYTVLKQGDGPPPALDSATVTVHYEGTLLDGKVFDSSIRRGQPAKFKLNQVIAGWKEGLRLMKVGSKYKFFVPPDLAYGRRGMPHDIKPNMMLIFEVELLGIEK